MESQRYNRSYRKGSNSLPPVTAEFTAFIRKTLSIGDLRPENVEQITNPENMRIFREAFVHNSYSKEFNYELLEFRGDKVLHAVLSDYLTKRFPKIVSVNWMSKLHHQITSKKLFSSFGFDLGFDKHVLISPEFQRILGAFDSREINTDRQSLIEDTFEAFCGAVVVTVEKDHSPGVGYAVLHSIISRFLDTKHISVDYEDIFDPKTRINDFYIKQKWTLKSLLRTEQNGHLYTATLLMPRQGAGTQVIGKSTPRPVKIDAEQEACKNGLKFLAESRIYIENKIDPEKRD